MLLAYEGAHYGVPAKMYWLDENKNSLEQVVEELKKDFSLLPVYENSQYDNMLINVLKAEKEYYVICGLRGVCVVTPQLPDDLDIVGLVDDLFYQKKGHKPDIIKSKFKKLFDDAYSMADSIVKNGIPEDDRACFELFQKKAAAIVAEREKTEKRSSFLDSLDSWDEKDPVEEEAERLYTYKLTADYLRKMGYYYSDMEYMAQLDHHDILYYENVLELLYDGYYWRDALEKYE